MAQKIIITLILFFGCITFSGVAQNSQATMRVSVKVVSGTSIETSQPDIAILSEPGDSKLGNIALNGIDSENTFITISEEILLKDSEGNEINLDISSQKQYNEDHFTSISFEGSSKRKMKSGSYRGELITTIQYM